jgi:hypothetical protein
VKVVEAVCGWATSKLERCIKKYDVALIELSPEGVLEVCWCETSQTEIFE